MSDLNIFTLVVFGLIAIALTAVVFCCNYFVSQSKTGATYQPYLPVSVLMIDQHGVRTVVMCPLKAWTAALPSVECYDALRGWRLEPSSYYAGIFTRIARSSV